MLNLIGLAASFGGISPPICLAESVHTPPPTSPQLPRPEGTSWRPLPPQRADDVARYHDAEHDITLTLTVVDTLTVDPEGATSPHAVIDDWEQQLRLTDPRVETREHGERVVNGIAGRFAIIEFQTRVGIYWGFVAPNGRMACFLFAEGPLKHREDVNNAFARALERLRP